MAAAKPDHSRPSHPSSCKHSSQASLGQRQDQQLQRRLGCRHQVSISQTHILPCVPLHCHSSTRSTAICATPGTSYITSYGHASHLGGQAVQDAYNKQYSIIFSAVKCCWLHLERPSQSKSSHSSFWQSHQPHQPQQPELHAMVATTAAAIAHAVGWQSRTSPSLCQLSCSASFCNRKQTS